VNLIIVFILYLLLIFFLNFFFLKKNFLIDRKQLVHKSFISKEMVPITGGFLIIANLLLFNNNYLENFFFGLIFTLGICSDLLIIKDPVKKLLIQFLIVFIFLLTINTYILSTKILFIDFFIKNKIFAIFFTTFCLLILINGSNFLDGVNTLVCGYYILIVLVILYIGHENRINYDFIKFYYLLISLLIIFLFNFFSKTYLGDSGTFLLSFFIGYQLINLSNVSVIIENYISPLYIMLLLWYPAFENLFSIIRKTLTKKKPSQSDNIHLHHLLFSYLKVRIKNIKIINSLTGIIINFYNLLIFIISIEYYYNNRFLIILVLINICNYTICYLFLLRSNSLLKKN